jgi:hypothetical protein
MTRFAGLTILALLAASCGKAPVAVKQSEKARPVKVSVPEKPAAAAPEDRMRVSEAPFGEASAQGAANVVQTYYALIAEGRYDQAWRLRWESDDAPASRAADFAKSFDQYREYHATVGAPSLIQGAAGSFYVEVPVQTYGVRRDGRPFGSAGTVTLRRAGDVAGASAEQRKWRIHS